MFKIIVIMQHFYCDNSLWAILSYPVNIVCFSFFSPFSHTNWVSSHFPPVNTSSFRSVGVFRIHVI